MPEIDPKAAKDAAAKEAVAPTGAVDRVAMLSIRSDGSVAQTAPVLIDEDFALDATKRQLGEKAVSDAEDAANGGGVAGGAGPRLVDEDPDAQKRLNAYEDVQAAGEKAAEKVVKDLTS